MRGLSKTLGALLAASVLTAPTWAASVTNEPENASFTCSFDGGDEGNRASGWITGWDGEAPSQWVDSLNGKGFWVTSSIHPHTADTTSWPNAGSYSLAFYGRLPTVTDDNTKLVVWGMGSKTGGSVVIEQTKLGPQLEYLKNTTLTSLVSGGGAISEGYHLIVVTVNKGESDTTFSLYVDGTQVGASVTKVSTDVACSSSSFQVGAIYEGVASTGLSVGANILVDELRGYNRVLTSEEITKLKGCFPGTVSYTADLSSVTTATYSSLTWSPSGTPTAKDNVTIKAASAGTTLTMDAAASISSLAVTGAGSLTFAGTNGLTVTTGTTISADTDVSAITASLGAVTIGEGKTLTMDNSTTVSLLAGTYSDTTPSQVIYNATAGNVSADATLRAAIRDFTGLVTVNGSSANGMDLPYIDAVANPLSSRIVFDGGTHTFKYGRRDRQRFATEGHGDECPTIDVKNGTTLNFALRDLSGWNGTVGTTPAVIRVRDGGILNIQDYDGSGFFRDRLVLDNNATVNLTGSQFILHGGAQSSENLAQIAMLGSGTAATATITGQLNITNEKSGGGQAEKLDSSIFVGSNATLKVTAKVVGTSRTKGSSTSRLTKEGAGVLEFSSAESTYSAPLEINAGKVIFKNGSSWGTGAITVADDATLELDVAAGIVLDNAILGGGTILKSGAGDAELTSASGSLKVNIQGGMLGIGTYRPTTLTIAEGAKVMVTPTEDEVTAGSLTLPANVTAAQILIPGYSISGVSEGTVTFGVVGDVTWTPTAENQDWTAPSLWSTSSVPTTGRLTIDFSALTAPATVTIPAGTYFESTTFVGGDSAECALEVLVNTPLALGTVNATSGNVTLPLAVVNAQSAVTVNNGTLTVKNDEDGELTTPLTGTGDNIAGAFAKSGDGVLTLNAAVRMANKTVVKAGTLKMGTEALTTTGDKALHDVDVLAGATLDVNGKAGLWLQTVTLYEDATYANSGSEIGSSQRQLVNLVLEGDAKVSGANDFGLLASGWGDTALTLNGHTLTKEGAGNFWLYNTTVTGGKTSVLAVSAGQFSVQGDSTNLASDVTLSTTKDSGDAITKDGSLTINTGATLTVAGRGTMLGGNGALTVSAGATLEFTSTGNISNTAPIYEKVGGVGTVRFSTTGNYYRYVSSDASTFLPSTLAIENNQTGGLVLSDKRAVYNIGTLSGTGGFRSDMGDAGTVTVRVTQADNSTYSGIFMHSTSSGKTRTMALTVAGAADATEKTLTLSGASTATGTLTVEDTGSVKLTGSWAGAVTVGGTIGGTGTVNKNKTLTFNDGATLDASAGALTVGTVAFAENATVTVTLPEDAAVDTPILTCANPADVVGKLMTTSMPDGLKFAATETAVVLAKAGDYKVGNKVFESLQGALASITTGETKAGTIVIEDSAPAEITLTEQILVNGADVGLDLGGKTLKVVDANLTRATAPDGVDSHSGAIWVYQGSLTIYNGTIESDGRVVTLGALNNSGAKVLNANTAELTLPAAFDDKTIATLKSTGKDAVVAFEGASLTTSGNISTTAVNCCAICGNGSKYNTAHITIEGGKISSKEDIAIYNPQYGSLTITGGSITGKTAVYVKGGEITITGGVLSGTGAYVAYTPYGNGAYATGDALVVDNHSGYAPLKVSITGGQFTSTSAAPIASYSNGNAAYPVLTGFVSDGKFSEAIAGSLCKNGKCCVANSDTETSADYPWTIGTLPAISGGEGGDVTIDTPEAKDVIGEIIANASATGDAPTAVEVLPGTKSGVALLPEAVADSLAIFGSSVTTSTTENGTLKITVSYDFGIDSMQQTAEGIVITAKVQKPNGGAAAFADGVTVKLVDEAGNEIATATPAADGTATFPAKSATDLVGTKLKVKATK